MKKVLFVVYHSPCGTVWPNEGFRTAFGMYGAEIEPAVLFIEQGVISLAKDTEPSKAGLLSLKMVQRYLKKYATRVYVERESLERYQVGALDEDYRAEVLSREQIGRFVHDQDFVIYM